MNKKTKLALLVGAIAAVVSAVILIIVFWDKLLSLCPCKKAQEECEDESPAEEPTEEAAEEEVEEVLVYSEEECSDFADLEVTAE